MGIPKPRNSKRFEKSGIGASPREMTDMCGGGIEKRLWLDPGVGVALLSRKSR